ncbi:malto-oligosyltrehalose trehalohydrolase [Eoetvoesiella caeni]|uniref:Malto-oligosyltrehalose trehalohydrolase n=1 Tax=Eoetvoesiella caeni TaxID=645616 RepID=A0A366HJT1_9BURK|nr:malto-oligosyltrehalose trehalohydrolase [Eoetvoesiella caeni]MCI2807387.1 malto-oligosyltrehalose trehalohydrolase [Eoetvoesiella caeni]NYT53218.1 malto-oligosyltrehalose trehalohydrolase [Eoetvoesiella caeni]RBP43198.1 maltooligosyl trehalose hydrolase [Eoetvoesiella caeni]
MAEACASFDYAFGAIPCGDGLVRFRVWAPGIERRDVVLEIEGQQPVPMDYEGGGYYRLTLPCRVGAKYRYRMGGGRAVPDPASRLQDGDVHDASVVCETRAYPWKNTDWRGRPWTQAVLYEIHCGLAGGFEGVEARLQGLAQLGVTALELMPIADFPGPRNWGYDGVLPYAPDCRYGTPDQLRHLVDAAHGLGMMVFLDVVYNHFGPDGNYLPSYAADFFRADIQTPWGPAIDFQQEAVQAFFSENALYWLSEFRFDGLRLDAVHAIADQSWPAKMARFVRSHIPQQRHIHLVLENHNNAASLLTQGFDAQWNDDGHHVLHYILTGETQGYYSDYSQQPTDKLARFLAEGFVYQGVRDGVADGVRGEPSAGLAPTQFVCFLQNHDQVGNRAWGERLVSLCKGDLTALHAAVALQLLMPHIPMLFMGEEYGAATPFHYFTSHEDEALARAVREGRRKEFAAQHAFETNEGQAGIPDPNDIQAWEASIVAAEPHDLEARQWRDYYRRLLGLRRGHVTPYLEGSRSLGVAVLAPLCVHARWRLSHAGELSIYCNLSQAACVSSGAQAWPDDFALFASKSGGYEALRQRKLLPACTVAVLRPSAHYGQEAS